MAVFIFWATVLLWIPLYGAENPWLVSITGVSLGFFILFVALFFFGLFSPLFIDLLVNNPRPWRDKNGVLHETPISPGRIYFFTFMEPGQTKVKIRGKKFVGAIMEDSKRVFVGATDDPNADHNPENAGYWWVRNAGADEKSIPIAPFNFFSPLSWWVHWVYSQSGAVFVGVWPLQGLRIVRNERMKPQKEGGVIKLDNKGRPILERVVDWSDHLRTKDFFWYFENPTADTKDYLRIGYQGSLKARCDNPYLASFNIDDWPSALTQALGNEITAYSGSNEYKTIASLTRETMHHMADFLRNQINGTLHPQIDPESGIGIVVLECNITDRDPKLEKDEQEALTAPWKAEQSAKATVTAAGAEKIRRIKISEGDARALINNIRVSSTHKDLALALAQFGAWKEVKGQALFNFGDGRGMGSTGNSALDAAILQKLTEIGEQLKNGGKS